MKGPIRSTTTSGSFFGGTEGAQERARTWPDRIRKGEPGAFHALFLRHSGELLGFVHCFLGDHERSEQVVQDAFLDLYRSRQRVGGDRSAPSELYRLATARLFDEISRTGAVAAISGQPGEPRILRAIRRLPLRQRIALLLNRVPSLRTRDVAEWLGIHAEELRRDVLDASRTLAAELHHGCTALREAS